MDARERLKEARRVVVKVGTSTLAHDTGKLDLYRIDHLIRELSDLKNQGKGILLISDELPELIGMSDRVYCFRRGKVSGEFSRDTFTEERLAVQMV